MIYKYVIIILIFAALIIGCAQRNPEESAKHLKAGVELQNKGKLDDAMNEYNQAIEMDKKNHAFFLKHVSNRLKIKH